MKTQFTKNDYAFGNLVRSINHNGMHTLQISFGTDPDKKEQHLSGTNVPIQIRKIDTQSNKRESHRETRRVYQRSFWESNGDDSKTMVQ